MIDREAEKILMLNALAGDKTARDQVVMSMHAFIYREAIKIAKRYNFDSDDLAQVGMMRVLEMFDKFDPARDVRPVTYFGIVAVRAMKDHAQKDGIIALPGSFYSTEEKQQYATQAKGIGSLNVVVPGQKHDQASFLEDYRGTEKIEDREELERLAAALKFLPESERSIVEQRLAQKTLREIGETLDLTKERVRQLEARAEDRLKTIISGLGGVSLNRYERYSSSEIRAIRRLAQDHSLKGIALNLGRPLNGLREKCAEIGIAWAGKMKPFTPADDAFLRANLDKPWTWHAQQLGRAPGTIRQRVQRIGLRHQKRIDPQEVLRWHQTGLTTPAIAQQIGFHHEAVRRCLIRLGIAPNKTDQRQRVIKMKSKYGDDCFRKIHDKQKLLVTQGDNMAAKPFARSYAIRHRADIQIKRPRAASQSYAPGQICRDYNWPTGIPITPLTIVIGELGGALYPNDYAAWAAKAALPVPTVKSYLLPGADNSPSDADGEVALDWQLAAQAYSTITGLAANILIVYGPNSGQAFTDVTKYANSLTGIGAGSWSWGSSEDSWNGTDLDNFQKALMAASFPWMAASGDNDSGDGASIATVDMPAGLPQMTGCGGTSKVPGNGAETVWNNGNGEGTGGGFSKIYTRPTWQLVNSQGTGRMVPDWAAVADPNTGYDTIINGQWEVIGGTSAVAPLMAGFIAAVNGTRLKAGLQMIGPELNSLLWSMAGGYFDIISGTNGAYRATAGPDPCSGMGRALPTLFAMLTGTSPVPPPVPPPVPVPPVPVPPPPGTPAFVLTVPRPIKAGQSFSVRAGKAIAAGKYDCFPESVAGNFDFEASTD